MVVWYYLVIVEIKKENKIVVKEKDEISLTNWERVLEDDEKAKEYEGTTVNFKRPIINKVSRIEQKGKKVAKGSKNLKKNFIKEQRQEEHPLILNLIILWA